MFTVWLTGFSISEVALLACTTEARFVIDTRRLAVTVGGATAPATLHLILAPLI